MNMDELLKSIWSRNFGSTSGGPQGGSSYLQAQGSIVLPRMLSLKTVDEVWKDMSKEYDGGGEKDSNGHVAGFGVPHRQPTLGEITLEEFLVRAGVVREEPNNNNNNAGLFGDFWHPVTTITNSNIVFGVVSEFSNPIATNLPLNVNGVRSCNKNHHFPQQILPKPPTWSQMGMMGGIGISSQATSNNNGMVQNAALHGGGLGLVGLGGNNSNDVGVISTRSLTANYSSDGLTMSNGDTSPVSPVPYVFNGGLRGRRSAALEKVAERRQRRMIKNRESAARSRARKQAYTTELVEVAKLKEEHEKLQKKQAEIMEMQKNQVLEMMKQQNGGKRQCLRRTQTGPW